MNNRPLGDGTIRQPDTTKRHRQVPTSVSAQIQAFVSALHEPSDIIEVRRLPSAVSTWHTFEAVADIVVACLQSNRNHENVYIGVNPRRAHGRRGNAGVARAWCLFADFDPKNLTTTTVTEQAAEVRMRIEAACLPDPTILLGSGHGIHVYWRMTSPLTDLERWGELMDALITALASDSGAKGADRIMRVPGLINWKPPVATAEIIECDPRRRYGWEDIACVVWHANLPGPGTVRDVERAVALHELRSATAGNGASVINAFNAAVPLVEVLRAGGYDVVGRYFRRPGKLDRGFSGIIRPNKQGRLVSAHWSSNDALNDRRFGGGTCGIHDAFDLFTLIDHGGNVSAAIKSAGALLGIELPRHKSDLTILEEVTDSADGETFAEAFFANPQTGAHRIAMRTILNRFTSNPKQHDRIIEMSAGNTVAA